MDLIVIAFKCVAAAAAFASACLWVASATFYVPAGTGRDDDFLAIGLKDRTINAFATLEGQSLRNRWAAWAAAVAAAAAAIAQVIELFP